MSGNMPIGELTQALAAAERDRDLWKADAQKLARILIDIIPSIPNESARAELRSQLEAIWGEKRQKRVDRLLLP